MKKAFCLLAAAVAFLSACQPTPQDAAVVGKNGRLIDLISAPALSTSQSIETAPESWREELGFLGGVRVVIDARIEIPDVPAFPVIEATPHRFTQQEAQNYVDVLMQGKPLFEMRTVRTRKDAEWDILRIKAKIEYIKALNVNDEEHREMKLDDLERELEHFEEEYQTAPAEEPEPIPAVVEFQPYMENKKAIMIQATLDDNVPTLFEMYAPDNGIDSMLSFFKTDRMRKYGEEIEAKDQLAGMALSKQDAIEHAMAFLESIGLTDIQLKKTMASSDGYADGINDLADNPDTQKSYELYFVRIISGIPVTPDDFSGGISTDSHEQKYDRVWPAERIRVWVDDGGVYGLTWSNMDDAGRVLNENVALLDFNQIMETFKKQIFYAKTWNIETEHTERIISIKRIKLVMMRVRLPDNQYAYLPVWDFVGDWTYADGSECDPAASFDVSILTLNAIDGSVIDRRFGY